MLELISHFLATDGLLPKSICLSGRNDIIFVELISEIVTVLSYLLIALAMLYLLIRRRERYFRWIFVVSATFMVSAGVGVMINAMTVWSPIYGAAALVIGLTAVLSLILAAALWSLMPRILAIPSRADLEARIVERTRELNEARMVAEAANQAKSEFIATMSHELRTPLNVILGFAEIMRDDREVRQVNDKFIEYAGDIHECGSHLLELINEILDLSKLDAGKFEIDQDLIDIDRVLSDIMRHLALRVVKAGHTLTHRIDPDARRIRADERAIKQILINLISNAIKYTKHDGQIVVAVTAVNGHEIAISVSDNGIGIPPERIERLGQPFEMVDNRYSRSQDGTGLGLALVKGLVALHGGRLTIDSVVDRGTTVTAFLPQSPAPDG